jgi:hypothetical protein
MARQSQNSGRQISTGDMVCGLAGMLCPVPVVGEGLLSKFFHSVIEDTPIFSDSRAAQWAGSFVIASLTRLSFYTPFYLPALKYIGDHLGMKY